MATLHIIALLVALYGCCTYAEKCDTYIQIINEFPDGYRGVLTVPVLADQNGWNIQVYFDKHVSTLDVPNANVQRRIKKYHGSSFNLTHLLHNMDLKVGTNTTQDFVVHFSRYERPRPKIQKIQLGAFVCEPETPKTTVQPLPVNDQCVSTMTIPNCTSDVRITRRYAQGYDMELGVLIKKSVSAWKLAIFFNVPVMILRVPDANIVTNINNTQFVIASKDNKGRLQPGQMFKLQFSVNLFRSNNTRLIQGLILDPVKSICGNQQFRKIVSERYTEKGVLAYEGLVNSKEICEDNLRYLDKFPDGFRAEFTTPVNKYMYKWKVFMEFDAHVSTFDTPNADILGGKKSGSVFVLKNKRHDAILTKDSKLKIEFTIHHARGKTVKIKSVRFEDYSCQSEDEEVCNDLAPIGADWLQCKKPTTPSPSPTTPQPPSCGAFFTSSTIWPDGEQGVINIPITENKYGWNVTVEYSKALNAIDVTQADKVQEKNRVHFVFRNKSYLARLTSGTLFKFGVTVHFNRGLNPKLSLVKFDNKLLCMG
eukprot:gene7296-8112_t